MDRLVVLSLDQRLIYHLLVLVFHNLRLKLVDGRVLLSHGVVGLHDPPDVSQFLRVHLLLHYELLLPHPLFLEVILDDVGHAHVILHQQVALVLMLVHDLRLV